MLKEYNDVVKGLSEREKRDLRKEWEVKLLDALDDQVVTLTPAVCLKKAQKHMLEAVHIL